ncbi:MAG TPA: hypothetical protein VNR61_00005, partial [Niallia sp.]|nr:hypothetical protein [Niallia sp.]
MRHSHYVVKEFPIELRIGGKLTNTRKIIIGFYDSEKGIVYPHPISDFIEKEYFRYSMSLSHQRQPANTVVQFLNFIKSQVDANESRFVILKKKGIPGLTIEHATWFLNHLTENKDISRDTFSIKVYHLTKFYQFLNENRILEVPVNIKSKVNKKTNKLILTPPFKELHYPPDNRINKPKK